MKTLVSTTEQQGDLEGDYCATLEGELVAVNLMECADRYCGCDRGFAGMGTSKATTTALVVDLPHLSLDDLRQAVADWLDRDGWLRLLDDEAEACDLVDTYVDVIERTAAAFPVGTVLGRTGRHVFARHRLAA